MYRSSAHARRLVAIVVGLLLVAGGVGVAYAHALPVKAVPGDGAVVTSAPAEVSMDTSQAMTTKAGDNDLIVEDAAGKKVTTGAATVDTTRKHMAVPLPSPLPPGKYVVRWFTVSAEDGESAQGTWSFTFDPAGTVATGTTPKPPEEHEEAEDHTVAFVAGGVAAALFTLLAVLWGRRQRREAA